MTFEETGRMLAENLPPDCASDFNERAGTMIAKALQEAADEALERAAAAMHPMLRSMISRGQAAEVIRSLKSKPIPSTSGGDR